MARIYGIECTLTPKDRAKVKAVLDRIRQRYPKDLNEIKRLVRVIEPYEGDDEECAGQWIPDEPYSYDRSPGIMRLRPAVPATIAHELGHVMTTHEDMERRESPDSEWASELAADWYAYRWGFGREIGATRKWRRFGHHCVGPGQSVELGIEKKTLVYRVTRNFCMRFVEERESKPLTHEERSAMFREQ